MPRQFRDAPGVAVRLDLFAQRGDLPMQRRQLTARFLVLPCRRFQLRYLLLDALQLTSRLARRIFIH